MGDSITYEEILVTVKMELQLALAPSHVDPERESDPREDR